MSTREKLKQRKRPARAVELPGGETVAVRSLTLAELERVDRLALDAPEGAERNVRRMVLICGLALCDDDGTPAYPPAGDVAAMVAEAGELLTPEDMKALAAAVLPTKDEAKNA
jgi:hypothetical protein